MSWDFETDDAYQDRLDWADAFVRERVEPLDLVLGSPYDKADSRTQPLVKPLQNEVKARGMWACHLGPELGGQGYGQVKLALLNEILGRSRFAPSVFGCQAPDSGNAEILARFGTDAQKERYLWPLLDGDIASAYSMTEPHAGADPALFRTTAVRAGDEWRITGEKWFSTNARYASFLLVMAVTDPTADAHDGMSMFIVPADTDGVEIVRDVGVGGEPERAAAHGYVRFTAARVPADHVLGAAGQAFAIAQARLGGGRVHHAMRTIGQLRRAFDMMCERAVSRRTRNGALASLGVVQEQIADSWIEIEQLRLLVLRTAWLIDRHGDYAKVRKDIAAVKAAMPGVYHRVVQRAMHLHGALGVSDEMPFVEMLVASEVMAIADGPTEVHKATLARQVLKQCRSVSTLFPSGHLPTRKARAERYVAEAFEQVLANS